MGRPARYPVPAAGARFGKLVVVSATRKVLPSHPSGYRAVVCACACGETTVVAVHRLYQERPQPARSCGCTRRVHGMWGHPLFVTHRQMLDRCEDPKHHAYANYGGRGIRVCDRWHDPAVFIADIERWLGPRPAGMTLDRIMNDHDYRLDNVRWATRSRQASNKRRRAVPS